MRISTPTEEDGPIEKEVTPGCGVRFKLAGSRYMLEGSVQEIDENAGYASVAVGGEVHVVPQAAIKDVISAQNLAVSVFLQTTPERRTT